MNTILNQWIKNNLHGGHQLLFLCAKDMRDFKKAWRKIPKYCQFPIEGSLWQGAIALKYMDGRVFFGITFNGDVASWKNGILDMCRTENRNWAEINNEYLVLDTNESLPVSDLIVCDYNLNPISYC